MLTKRRAVRLNLCSPGRTRTSDLVINSHPLYQLSYRGMQSKRSKKAHDCQEAVTMGAGSPQREQAPLFTPTMAVE